MLKNKIFLHRILKKIDTSITRARRRSWEYFHHTLPANSHTGSFLVCYPGASVSAAIIRKKRSTYSPTARQNGQASQATLFIIRGVVNNPIEQTIFICPECVLEAEKQASS